MLGEAAVVLDYSDGFGIECQANMIDSPFCDRKLVDSVLRSCDLSEDVYNLGYGSSFA
jgi:hypothetical protein